MTDRRTGIKILVTMGNWKNEKRKEESQWT